MAARKPRLDRATIVSTALDLIDESGLDAFTTRRLADRLQVQQPALYWHFPGKTALLEALADELLVRGHTASLPEPGDTWRSFLDRNARSFRAALSAVRDGARIHAGTRPRGAGRDTAERQVAFLVSEGFDARDAVYALIAISRYTVGVVLEEQAADESAELDPAPGPLSGLLDAVAAAGPDAEFDFGLAALLDGIASRRT
ncbi:TetR/AcrR family transcriptional regulator C-terminal domain-containing protein [Microtetraspora fusca]|uniref:TetR/AcrR family transcriptional regulator C-terminal domain-containing protein n=1 Tax=Microtetraspora fusca TaxID=1997 RepID=UPI0008294FE9|nr:TetR/AcrR family transcriptional regulator C-terminal domain-containing protein [Microtetraspora fusca]